MSAPLLCRTPGCGDGERRSVLGCKVGPYLIVPATARVRPTDDGGYVIVCERCGQAWHWIGKLARDVDRRAA